ncbi:spondin domain-containing protein [Lacinutrix mariniflava]|uniref:T9SS type A sorting domain-containing protein n=1 Tax=Lacinutrix mariniflava TaxID=342955 RepID=UPI0006E14FB5|nr:spondin domain-containing protein [Lacinutrix mariniflava]
MKKTTLLTYLAFSLVILFSINSHSQSSAIYDVTFNSTWNASEHTSIPANDHYSNLVGATHKNENEYLELGQNASTGIKNMAELGNNGTFMNEVQSSTNTKEWLDSAFSPNNAENGSATITNIEVTEEHHLLTLVSMIAPSPDWFIAINSLDLRNDLNTDWKPSFTLDVFVYDSGTDSGSNYNSANAPTNPAVAISMITAAPFNSNKVGELVITFKSSTLSTPEFESVEKLKLFPNPSYGNVSILGSSIAKLKSVEIYNILGSKVKDISISTSNNRFELNTSDLNKGVYLVKMNDNKGNSKTQKLVLQ